VLLNRADASARPEQELLSRGGIVLESVLGRSPEGEPPTHGFNLVEVRADGSRVLTWDGEALRTIALAPGTHMIAHDDVDDPATPRIARWLGDFQGAPVGDGDRWWDAWLDVLRRSAELEPTDDRAIIRDNRPLGYPTLSLLACVASVSPDGIEVAYGELAEPGHWDELDLA
jgi:hypothetical protein